MTDSLDHSRFAAFILSHGRPNALLTTDLLRRVGYTGDIWYVVDDEDPALDGYRDRFGDRVLVFSKAKVAETFDEADTNPDRRSIVYARNATRQFADSLGLDYHLQLDDDYTMLRRRNPRNLVTEDRALGGRADEIFGWMLDLLDETGAHVVAWPQGGDLIGGMASQVVQHGHKRKAMNTLFMRRDRPVVFYGRINEDVNTYCVDGSRGRLFFTVPGVQLEQKTTQTNPGGMTDLYLSVGSYTKSMFTVMMCPSFVVVAPMGPVEPRWHHRIAWDYAVPKIISPQHQKPRV